MDGLMSIGAFSAISGLSPKRLRSYAVGGLLVPAAVDADSAYRYYSPDQLPEAELIDVLRGAGMPLAVIKVLLQDPRAARLDEWARQVRSDADHKQAAIARARELLPANQTAQTGADNDGGVMARACLQVAGRTETGSVRENNQDAVVVADHLVAVADGMGGHAAGEIASMLATAAVVAVFTGKSVDELEAAVRAANWAIWERACHTPGLQGMGTTLCAVGILEARRVGVTSVGDSRAYLTRNGSLRQLTEDHTVVGELVRQGKLTPQEAAEHPHRHLLTRAVGVAADVVIDTTALQVDAGDRILVCSDGVHNMIRDDQIAPLLNKAATPQAAVDAVVELALEEGGQDNASAVAAFVAA